MTHTTLTADLVDAAATIAPVTYLFVPAARPDRFEKALASGADRVIVDLEDAVDADEKSDARQSLRAALLAGLSAPVLVRVNAADSPWFAEDLQMLSEVMRQDAHAIAGIVLPKVERAKMVRDAREAAGDLADDIEMIGLIESAEGVLRVADLAASGLTRLGVGAVDLSVDLGSEVHSPLLNYVYVQAVLASRAAGISAPIGSPPLDIHDGAGIEATARSLKAMGVTGQLCIHPAQVTPLHTGYAPTQAQVEWAHRVLSSTGGSTQVDGQMVDRPVRDRARQLITLASRRNL